MLDRRALLGGSAAALAGAVVRPASAVTSLPGRRHAGARLFPGAPGSDRREAGLEIVLDPGFKTYWRHPGESGLPPAFDWGGSDNLAQVAIGWPAPRRVEDAAGIAYAYEDSVVLPLDVTPRDPGLPVRLRLRLDYGVCRDICIPERDELACTLSATSGGRPEDAALIGAARRTVPVRRLAGAPGTPSILSAVRAGPDRLAINARIDRGQEARLFVEMAEPWFLLADAEPDAPSPDGTTRFTVAVLQRPEAAAPLDVTLTLVNGAAVETRLTLDAALLAR